MIGFAYGVIIIHRHEWGRVVSGWGLKVLHPLEGGGGQQNTLFLCRLRLGKSTYKLLGIMIQYGF